MNVPRHALTTAAMAKEAFIMLLNCSGFFMEPSMLGKTACAVYEKTVIPKPTGNVWMLKGGMFVMSHTGTCWQKGNVQPESPLLTDWRLTMLRKLRTSRGSSIWTNPTNHWLFGSTYSPW